MSGSASRNEEVARAAAVLDGVHDAPAAAEVEATKLLGTATDPEAVQLATWARGKARHELGRYDDALVDLRRAAEVALARGDAVGAARIGANRALTEHAVGDAAAARASLDGAEAHLVGGEAGHLHLQRAIIQVHAGNLLAGRLSFDQALALLEAAGDRAAVLRCLTSRGVACTYLGDLDAATDDLTRAATLADELGQRLIGAGARHNLGYVRARAGDARGALDHFAEAEALYASVGSPERVLAALDQDRAEVLLDAGLLPEAVRAARAATARHLADGADTAAQDSELLLVEALLASGALAEAEPAAHDLATRLVAAGRAPQAARATAVAVRAALARAPEAAEALAGAEQARAALTAYGWRTEADRLVVDVCAGLVAHAPSASWVDALRPIAATRSSGPATARLRGWHAEALVRHAAGDRPGAMRAVRSGLHVADEHRRALAGDEVRAGAAHRSSALAELGLRLAIDGGRAAAALEWSEQGRARTLLDSLPAPGDAELATLLVELRQAREALGAEEGSVAARRRVTTLEHRIRDLDHRRDGASAAGRSPIGAADLRERLGDWTLVSYVGLEGRLHALVVTPRRVRAVPLGPLAPVRETVDQLVLAMSRLVRGGTSPGLGAALAAFDADRSALADLLGAHQLGDGPVVVVPSSVVPAVPWMALPPLVGRPVVVTPSATHWCRDPDPPATGRPLFAAGPGLAHAEAEVAAIAGPDADVLVGDAATVDAVVAAFGARRRLHVAAHGEFRSDAPLFGGVDLVDGRLTVLDLRAAPGHPELVVLPACHLAASRALAGGESLGAVAALLGLGVRTVVAPQLAVADDVAADLMRAFHAQLSGHGQLPSREPAAALGAAVGEAVRDGGPASASAAAFSCLGWG